MKYAKYLLTITALLALLFTSGCDNGGEDDGEEEVASLIGTWRNDTTANTDIETPSSVPENIRETLKDFSITIEADDNDSTLLYRTQNTEQLIFPTQGTFDLPEEANFEAGTVNILRNPDNVLVSTSLETVDSVSLLLMNFIVAGTDDEGSRTAQVKGEYNFRLAKTQ